MRDVLGNMEELASEYAFRDMGGDFEILTIERSERPNILFNNSRTPSTREIFSAELTSLSPVSRQVA